MPRISADFPDVFALILLAASTLAAAWLFVRYRRTRGGSQADDGGVARLAGSPQGRDEVSDTAERYATLRWLVCFGTVASAVALTALIVGDPILVLNAVALALVAIAFLLIVILVPRGL
jgi:hypothetical protein